MTAVDFLIACRRGEPTHSTPRSDPSTALRTGARGMLRVDTERRFLPRFKNRGLAPSNVSILRERPGIKEEVLQNISKIVNNVPGAVVLKVTQGHRSYNELEIK